MKMFLIICVLLATAQAASIDNRIVGGHEAKPGQFKYIASLRNAAEDRHFCGSTIISKRTLITAAHCRVYDVDDIVAVVGTTQLDDANAKRYRLKDFIIHPEYNEITITNDVGVVILEDDIVFNELVQPLSLTTQAIETNQRLISCGWGYTSFPGRVPNDLQWMNMNVLDLGECKITTSQIVTGKICTLEEKGKGICSGDSGGPLVNDKQQLVGITSAAYLCALGKPDFFTDVYYFKDWILENALL